MDARQQGEVMGAPKLLVTGAAGFTGRHACAFFAEAGMEVIGVLRAASPERTALLRRLGAAAEVCDLDDERAVDALLARVRPDYALHLAGLNAVGPSWEDPALYIGTNVMATIRLLEAVRRHRPDCRVVVAGSMLRYRWPASDEQCPAPPHPYALSKTMQVSAVRSWHRLFGLSAMVAEPGNLIGPGPSTGVCALIARHVRAARAAATEGRSMPPFRLSSAGEERDYVDVRDAVAAYGHALLQGAPGAVYPIVSGTRRPLAEVAEVFGRLSGGAIAFEYGRAAASAAEAPEPPDGNAIRALGWRPRVPFERSAADMLADAEA